MGQGSRKMGGRECQAGGQGRVGEGEMGKALGLGVGPSLLPLAMNSSFMIWAENFLLFFLLHKCQAKQEE